MAVEVDVNGLARAWRTEGGESFWIHFVADRDDDAGIDAVRGAVEDAASRSGPDVGLCDTATTPKGPVSFVDFCDSRDGLEQMADALTTALTAHGWSGRVTGLRREAMPYNDWDDGVLCPSLGLVVPMGTDTIPEAREDGWDRWGVVADRTQQIMDLACEFVLGIHGEVWLYHQTGFRIDRADARTQLEQVVGAPRATALATISPDGVMRRVLFNRLGHLAYQVYIPGASWEPAVEVLIDLATIHAPLVTYGLARHAAAHSPVWANIIGQYPPRDAVSLGAVYPSASQRLAASHLADVAGIQLLTDQHLARLDDLTGFTVRPLGHGRHLLVADDLDPWFHDPYRGRHASDPNHRRFVPPIELVEHTRTQFDHAMIHKSDLRFPSR